MAPLSIKDNDVPQDRKMKQDECLFSGISPGVFQFLQSILYIQTRALSNILCPYANRTLHPMILCHVYGGIPKLTKNSLKFNDFKHI